MNALQLRAAATAAGAATLHWLLALANELCNVAQHWWVATGTAPVAVAVTAHGNEVAADSAYCIFKYAEHVSASQRLSGCVLERCLVLPPTPPPVAMQMSTTSVPPLFARAVQQCGVAYISHTNTSNASMCSYVCVGCVSVSLPLFRKVYCFCCWLLWLPPLTVASRRLAAKFIRCRRNLHFNAQIMVISTMSVNIWLCDLLACQLD